MQRAIALLLLMTCSWQGMSAEEPATESAADIAKKLANPIASLISLPIQFNYDDGYGADGGGSQLRVNVQPVIPFSLNDDWNVISRSIVPLIDQQDFPTANYSEFGLGDTVQSMWVSPKALTASGWTWGAGPVFLLPTATDEFLGGEQWGAGPTVIALKQSGPWTYGALANHIESFAGDSNRADISATFLQPFLTYITPGKLSLAVNTESTYDWENKQWSVPINFQATQLLKVGAQLLQVGGGIRYWADAPDSGPDGWGLRFNFVLVFPR